MPLVTFQVLQLELLRAHRAIRSQSPICTGPVADIQPPIHYNDGFNLPQELFDRPALDYPTRLNLHWPTSRELDLHLKSII
ncbi:hypothetical protein PGT21_032101 [Puccinia graminis f. sp. tritici]|uniref:Uncharacterized protein n=1 Tax=Puccinia graminis f. sp. tritici TaxID=56615 RepID=A0A5B0Q750_PUCGR|nr:hypothetical protein PGT21_032101 [Puccinia graminis f. sp. tritici]